jgi:hypothetical protein
MHSREEGRVVSAGTAPKQDRVVSLSNGYYGPCRFRLASSNGINYRNHVYLPVGTSSKILIAMILTSYGVNSTASVV